MLNSQKFYVEEIFLISPRLNDVKVLGALRITATTTPTTTIIIKTFLMCQKPSLHGV